MVQRKNFSRISRRFLFLQGFFSWHLLKVRCQSPGSAMRRSIEASTLRRMSSSGECGQLLLTVARSISFTCTSHFTCDDDTRHLHTERDARLSTTRSSVHLFPKTSCVSRANVAHSPATTLPCAMPSVDRGTSVHAAGETSPGEICTRREVHDTQRSLVFASLSNQTCGV